MKKCLFFATMAIAFITQSCGDDTTEQSEARTKGSLANESGTEVETKDSKFLCDLEWTEGYKRWDYDVSSDNSIGTDKVKDAPWCLIPYGKTTSYKFYFAAKAGESYYICRDNKDEPFYKMLNEDILGEISIDIGEKKRIMKCVVPNTNGQVSVTASGATQEYPNGDPNLPNFRNDRLYHVVKMDRDYIIEGHLNLKLVRPVQFTVGLAFVNTRDVYNSVNNNKNEMVDSLKSYMSKAGYTLNISSGNVLYPNDLIAANNLYNQYDYVVGVMYDPKNSRTMASSGGNIHIIKDDDNFFNEPAKVQARLLAALLYSKILWVSPLEDQKESWLSSYSKGLIFSQPSKDWETKRIKAPQNMPLLLEFTYLMQDFERRTK